jgi:TolB-like protein/Tfp pilus assembly protein PilF
MEPHRPSAEEVRAALQSVAASEGFASAGRLPLLLRHLVEAALAGQTDRLKESVLGIEFFGRDADFDPRIDSVVRVEARRLRSRLEDYYAGPGREDRVRILLPKGGYVPVFEYTSSGGTEAPRNASAGTAPHLTPMPRGWKLAGILVLLAATGIGLGWWQAQSMRRLREAPAATIAVLPFENAGGDPGGDYFSEGLTEEVINRLARTPGLRVVARSLTAAYRGKAPSLDEIAAKFQASMLVEGSVRRQGQRLRVTARLVSVRDGATLWAESYERKMADVFAIQDEIAQSIAMALRVRSSSPGTAPPAVQRPASLEAYHLYLRGRQQTNMNTAESMLRAVEYFEEALRLDPGYAPALASLSSAVTVAGYYRLIPPAEAFTRARQAARRAVDTDPLLAEAHAALGLSLAWQDWNWSAAEAEFRKAIEADPHSATARGFYAVGVLLPERRLKEAQSEFRTALDLDPLPLFLNYTYAFFLLADGRPEDAVHQYERVLELEGLHPDVYWDYGMALAFAGRTEEARRAFRTSRQRRSAKDLEPRGLEALLCGDRETARRDAAKLAEAAAAGREEAVDAARLFAALGEKEQALDWLEIAVERREPEAVWVKADPRLASLRGMPRHDAVVRRVGLTPESR